MLRALGELDAVNAELAKPNLSFMAKNALYAQRDHLLTYLGNVQMNVPTTVGEVGLVGLGLASNVGMVVRPLKDSYKLYKYLRQGQKIESLSEASQLMRALNLEVKSTAQAISSQSALRNVVDATSFSKTSKITALERKGRVMFDNVEFRAVRDLSHIDNQTLFDIYRTGRTPKDQLGNSLIGHHYKQIPHRKEGAFIVEIPKDKHNISNNIQHPHGNKMGSGLNKDERRDWDKLRVQFNKERARQELIRRGLINDN